MPNMDPRSLKFLEDNSVNHNFHIPKRVNKKMLNYFDKFLAVDLFVLNQLNMTYPKFKNKFLSLTLQFSDVDIIDPFKLNANNYIKIMESIKFVAERINLDEI